MTPSKSPSIFVLGLKASAWEIQGCTAQPITVCAGDDPGAASRSAGEKSAANWRLSRETDVHATGTSVPSAGFSSSLAQMGAHPKQLTFSSTYCMQRLGRQRPSPLIEPSEAGTLPALMGHCWNQGTDRLNGSLRMWLVFGGAWSRQDGREGHRP